MATSPAFAASPKLALAQISTANTNRDGTGTIATLVTGAASGTRVEELHAQAAVTTTAGMVRVFLSTDAGTTWRLFDELPVSAVTVAASTPGWRTKRAYSNLLLQDANSKLGVSTHNAETFNVTAFSGDL